ncbi:protein MLP2-like [Lucilia cuprina]|uniref:protein MLP2-like n=1 Tax=Lucilia cuprina TaxID=7375 RepID=UPI001F06229F|nr:protein MLP2-like [Lucilia cuprina]
MQFHIQTNICTLTITLFVLFINFQKANGDGDHNTFESTFNGVASEMNSLKSKLISANYELESLHNKLHLQTDMVNMIRTEVDHKAVKEDQCDTSELFDELDNKLRKIKQNFHKVINNNDDKHLDKMDSILQNVKASKGCNNNDDTAQLHKIKAHILENLQKFNQYIERLEVLEKRFEQFEKTDENDTSIMTHANKPDLDNIINQINAKLLSQEKTLLQYDEHLNEMKNISATVESHLKARKEKSKRRCTKDKCVLYKLIEMDKSLNITKHV